MQIQQYKSIPPLPLPLNNQTLFKSAENLNRKIVHMLKNQFEITAELTSAINDDVNQLYFYNGTDAYKVPEHALDSLSELIYFNGYLMSIKAKNVKMGDNVIQTRIKPLIESFLAEKDSVDSDSKTHKLNDIKKHLNVYKLLLRSVSIDSILLSISQSLSLFFIMKNNLLVKVTLSFLLLTLGKYIGACFITQNTKDEFTHIPKLFKYFEGSAITQDFHTDPLVLYKHKIDMKIASLIVDVLVEANILKVNDVHEGLKLKLYVEIVDKEIADNVVIHHAGFIPTLRSNYVKEYKYHDFIISYKSRKDKAHTKIILSPDGEDVLNISNKYCLYNTDILLKELNVLFQSHIGFYESLSFIYKFYHIDLFEIGLPVTLEEHILTSKFIDYCLDLTNFNYSTLLKDCKDSPYKRLIKTITGQKYFLVSFINKTLVFKNFSYFYLNQFSSSTGRMYTYSDTITFQGNAIAGAFLGFKQHKGNKDYKKSLFLAYINSKFKIIDDRNTLNYFNPYFNLKDLKEINQFFPVLSLIKHFNNNEPEKAVYSLDATSSGIQIISLLLQDKDLAIMSNIHGTKAFDIYKQYAGFIKSNINCIFYLINTILDRLPYYKITFAQVTELYKKHKFTTLRNKQNSSLDNDIIEPFLYIKEILNIDLLELIPTKFRKKGYGFILNYLKDIYDKFNKAIKDKPNVIEIITNRNLNKKPIMTIGYNIGRRGIRDHYYDHLKTQIFSDNLHFIVDFMYTSWKAYVKKELYQLTDFKNLMHAKLKTIEKDKGPISMENKFMRALYLANEKKIVRVNLANGRKLNYYFTTDQKDIKQTKMSFSPLFIHNIDALICFLYRTLLSKLGLVGFTNHDRFLIPMSNNTLLRLIIKTCYEALDLTYHRKFLNLELLDSNNFKVTNKHFIKH